MFITLRQQSTFAGRRFAATTRSRTLHNTSRVAASQREAQHDKDKINAEPNEYNKGGTDSKAATDSVAFDASKTSPESQKAAAGSGLDTSPANTDLGKPASNKDDPGSSPSEHSSSSGSRARTSGGGGPQKSGTGPQ